MTEREALKLALEALKGYRRELNDDQPCDAEQDIEKLLAQPEQEPYGWYIDGYGAVIGTAEPKSVRIGEWLPWYTTPPQRKPFNHHEFGYWWFEYGSGLAPLEGEDQEQHAYRVATEAWKAAHGIKGHA